VPCRKSKNGLAIISEKDVKRKPDLMVVVLALFGLGVVITLLAPLSATRSVAEPVSALQAGVLTDTMIGRP
jgi:hypothetical protein